MRTILSQSTTILKKNLLLDWRNKSELLKELLVPFMSVIVLIASNHVDKIGLNLIDFMLPIYLPGSFNGLARRHLITFVQEKQERFKESQKVANIFYKKDYGAQYHRVYPWLADVQLHKGCIYSCCNASQHILQ